MLDEDAAKTITNSSCYCSMHSAMRRMGSIVIHGVHDERDEIDSIYVAMNPGPIINGRSIEYFLSVIDPLIAHIDVAFRKVVPLKLTASAGRAGFSIKSGMLSVREREIMKWITEGKTNLQIAEIVGISSFTVKNHVQRIFRKLGATNRTQAVAMHRKVDLRARSEIAVHQGMLAAE
jgi:DNA-binding CsgD family transcriptional regulator